MFQNLPCNRVIDGGNGMDLEGSCGEPRKGKRWWRRQLTPEKAKKLGGKGITRNLGQFSTRLTRPPSNNDYPYGCSFRFLEIPRPPSSPPSTHLVAAICWPAAET